MVSALTDASALPPGRAWTAVETVKVNDHRLMSPDRFEPFRLGRIELVARGFGGPAGNRGYGLVWGDSTWTIRWTLDQPIYSLRPTLTPLDHQMLVWKTTLPPVDDYYGYLVTSDVVEGGVTRPDTVARVSWGALVYAGTSWGDRRWVAVRDQDFSVLGFPEVLRIYRRDEAGPWRMMGSTGLEGRWGMSIVALDSLTVLVLSGEYHAGTHWGYLRDTTFEEQTPPVTENRLALGPSLTPRPAGGYNAAWLEAPHLGNDRVVTRRFRDGIWSPPDSVSIRFPDDKQYLIDQVVLSAEGSETPAIAWSGWSANSPDAADFIWASVPTDSGLGEGERLDFTRLGANPTLVRDENGDVWLAWWRFQQDGIFWTHTYTAATSSAPVIGEHFTRPVLRWTLSGPAPGTWWGVLRAEAGKHFERVARVRVGADVVVTWADTSAPLDRPLRYAIRRECRDVRYQWQSAESRWEPRGPALALSLRSGNPSGTSLEIEIVGANQGDLDIRLYDLQGREVRRTRVPSAGSGRDTLRMPLGQDLSPGLYLLRAKTADGRLSAPVKVALVP